VRERKLWQALEEESITDGSTAGTWAAHTATGTGLDFRLSGYVHGDKLSEPKTIKYS